MPALAVADEVGLFSLLSAGAFSTEETAERLRLNARSLAVMLGVLRGLEFVSRSGGRWQAQPIARAYLDPHSPRYWGPALLHYRAGPIYQAVIEMVRRHDDNTSLDPTAAGWEQGEVSDERAARLAASMNAMAIAPALGVARTGDFAGVSRFLDVGGGSGAYAITVAQVWKHLHASVMDLGPMCDVIRSYIEKAGVADRVDTLARDIFRDPWPQGYDATFFSNVFHDWNETQCTDLARKAYGILPSGGRIFLNEMLIDDDGAGPLTAMSFSLQMLTCRGRQYSFAELSAILRAAGFTDISTRPTAGYFSLVSGVRPS